MGRATHSTAAGRGRTREGLGTEPLQLLWDGGAQLLWAGDVPSVAAQALRSGTC